MELKNYDFIKTEDGSVTVFSKEYNETCHSEAGARSETQVHYIEGCKVISQQEDFGPINILEVGFGIGLGFKETLKALDSKFTFVSLEIDEELIKYLKSEDELFKDLVKKDNYYFISNEKFDLYIIIGNAREELKLFQKNYNFKFDCIYQDAFSPKRNAILWTSEWFSELFSYAKENCIMSTYSASSSIRKSMIAGGWKLYNGAKFGNKRASTRAKTTGTTPEDIIEHLNKSPVITITDENYIEYTMDNR